MEGIRTRRAVRELPQRGSAIHREYLSLARGQPSGEVQLHRHGRSVLWRPQPVFVLTSAATFSGGEELAYDLQVLKRATIVGETTAGAANPGGPIPLGDRFVVFLPTGQGVNPVSGTGWEGVGVKPDIAADATVAVSKAHVLAVERLRATAPRSAGGCRA